MVSRLLLLVDFQLDKIIRLAGAQSRLYPKSRIALADGRLERPATSCSVTSDIFQIDSCGYDFYVVQGELGALCYDVTIHGDERTAVVV